MTRLQGLIKLRQLKKKGVPYLFVFSTNNTAQDYNWEIDYNKSFSGVVGTCSNCLVPRHIKNSTCYHWCLKSRFDSSVEEFSNYYCSLKIRFGKQ